MNTIGTLNAIASIVATLVFGAAFVGSVLDWAITRWTFRTKLWRWVAVPDEDDPRARDSGPLMYRFRLARIPAVRFLRIPERRIAIHKIVQADDLRYELHDHPWDFWSIVLWGMYFEQYATQGAIPSAFRWRTPLSCASHPASYRHAIISVARRPCYTLIVTSGRVAKWGFPSKGIVVG